MLVNTLLNFQNYHFMLIKDDNNLHSIRVTDLFGRDLGQPNRIILTGLSQDKIQSSACLQDELIHQFEILREQSSHTGGKSFNIEFKKDKDITAIIIGPYGLPGGGLGNFLGLVASATITIGGVAIIAATGGLAAGPIAATLSAAGTAGFAGAGISGAVYSVTTDEEDLNPDEFLVRSAIGFAAGSASGGVATALAPASNVATTILGDMARSAASNVSGTVVSSVTEAIVRSDETILDRRLDPTALALQVAGGAIGEQAKLFVSSNTSHALENTVGKALQSKPMQAIAQLSEEDVRKIKFATCDGIGGSVGSMVGRTASNAITGKNLRDNVVNAGIVGAASGTLHGYRRAVVENSRLEAERQAEERTRAEFAKTKEKQRAPEKAQTIPPKKTQDSAKANLKKPSAETLEGLEEKFEKVVTIFNKANKYGFISKAEIKALREFRHRVKISTQNKEDIPDHFVKQAEYTLSLECDMLLKKVENIFSRGRSSGTVSDSDKLVLLDFRNTIKETAASQDEVHEGLERLSEETIRFQAAMMLNEMRLAKGEVSVEDISVCNNAWSNSPLIPDPNGLAGEMNVFMKQYLQRIPRHQQEALKRNIQSLIQDSDKKIDEIDELLDGAERRANQFNHN